MSALQDLAPRDLLDRARQATATARTAEAETLLIVAAWADAHPRLDDHGRPEPVPRPDQDALAAHFVGLDEHHELDAPAWAGLPPVAWSAPAALGTALGLSTTAARALLRDVLVLRHRLPRIWARAVRAEVPVWRARRIASAVCGAPDDVCAAIDGQLARTAHTLGAVTLDRALTVAMARLHPDEVEMASLQRLQRMHVAIRLDQMSFDGLSSMDAVAEHADLAQLDETLTALADRVHEVDPLVSPHDPLPYRRAIALGVLADPVAAAALLAPRPPEPTDAPTRAAQPNAASADADDAADDASGSSGPEPSAGSVLPARLRTTIVLHLTPDGLRGADPVALVARRLGGPVQAALADVVAHWCGREGTDVRVLPVVHLGEAPPADPEPGAPDVGYRPSAATRRAVLVRDATCRFPWCTRPSAGCDLDHVRPWPHGPTHPDNLVPLCRHHHRLKTLAGYVAEVVTPGTLAWRTPHGRGFLVDRDGTHVLPDPGPADQPPGHVAPDVREPVGLR